MIPLLNSSQFLMPVLWPFYERIAALVQELEGVLETLKSSQDLSFVREDFQKIQESTYKFGPLLETLSTFSSVDQDDSFWSHVRHDLKTPLNAIRGYTEMILEDWEVKKEETPPPEDLKKILKLCEEISQAMGEITRKNLQETAQEKTDSLSKKENPSGSSPFNLSFKTSKTGPTLKGTFLVVDDQEANREVLSRRLSQEGHTFFCVENGPQALSFLKTHPVDIILLDLVMPEMNGFEVLQILKKDPTLQRIPVIMISAVDELDKIATCIEAGAEDYLPKPFNPSLLRARIGACLDKKSLYEKEQAYLQKLAENQKILEAALESMEHGFAVFNGEGFCTLRNSSFSRLYEPLVGPADHSFSYRDFWEKGIFQKIFLLEDRQEPSSWLQERLSLKKGENRTYVQKLRTGQWIEIHESLTADGTRVVIHKDITDRKSDEEKLAFMAYHDPLTGLANRQEFYNQLTHTLSQTPPQGCAVLFCDLDGFKQVNDRWGHEAGDVLLQHVARALSQSVRQKDGVARLGGDEFSLLVTDLGDPSGMKEEIEKIIERIFKNVGTSFSYKEEKISFGMSIGVAFFPQDGQEVESLLTKADSAMYEAKRAGKGTHRFASEKVDA